VLDVATGDSVVLQGVNYFSVDAKVRFTDKQTGVVVRDVDAYVFGDIQTPATEVVNGQTVLINDCRVRDRLTFSVPNDLVPALYQIQVVVPNITGISAFGPELVSNSEYINVIPPATARFQIVIETVIARKETSPDWLGSDEVGLQTLASAFDTNFAVVLPAQDTSFKQLQDVDFDTGTRQDPNTIVFQHDQAILGVLLVVCGDEIDSQRYYDKEITSRSEFFIDLLKKEWAAVGVSGLVAILKLGPWGWIATGIAAALTLAVDAILTIWAPADPIIRDSIGLSVTDLATLTNVNAPPPDPTTFTAEDGIVVNVNKTIPPEKAPSQYRETREYLSSDQDSRYELIYRYNRVA